uniref:Macrophage-capping protein n=1 Tax=Canis lupus familiaris TaxID=9615 RepID=A0A8C0RYB0_CANLF
MLLATVVSLLPIRCNLNPHLGARNQLRRERPLERDCLGPGGWMKWGLRTAHPLSRLTEVPTCTEGIGTGNSMYTSLPQGGSPFPGSVQDPGLHVWRVEKLKPVPVARENQGIFFSGDSYLVLHNGPEELSHLHLWIGKEAGGRVGGVAQAGGGVSGAGASPPGQQSSRDEQGACAVLAVHLNTLLGERPVQHREVQGNESDLFMSYFPRGLKYQEGGVESAFHKTSPGATAAPIKKLYQVKGKKNIRATERALSWDSFNTGDCFILDLGPNIFTWCGGKSNILERNKARDLALAIRDSERQGKAQVEIVTDGEEPAEMIQVLGPKPALKEGNPEEDLTADRTNAQAAALYKVSDATGQMNLTKVADSSPFALELLLSDDCFVLDNGLCGKIYIWKGRKANEKERQAALQVAEDFISRMRYAPNTQVEILPQGRESPIFKQFFKDWK